MLPSWCQIKAATFNLEAPMPKPMSRRILTMKSTGNKYSDPEPMPPKPRSRRVLVFRSSSAPRMKGSSWV